MITLKAVQDHLGVWIPQVQGKYINEDWEPVSQGFGAQCWDLAANWSKSLGLPVINTGGVGRWPGWAGNMVDAFPQTPAIAAAYELVGPNRPGLPGDIVVWDDSNPTWYPKTHVAVLVRDPGSGWLTCMSLNSTPSRGDNPYPNWSTGPTTLQTLPKAGLIGFIRPRTGITLAPAGTINASEEDDPLAGFSRADLVQIAAEGTIQALRTKGEFQDGRNAIDHLNQIRTELGNTKASVEHVPATILYEEKVGGRNLFDWLKHNVAVTAGIKPGTIDVEALAAALSEQLEAKDVAELAAKLQITVKEG